MLQMDTEPEGIVEQAGDKLGVLKRRVKGDLGRFKEMIESRGGETGAWRGDVEPARRRAAERARAAQPRARRARTAMSSRGGVPSLPTASGGEVLDERAGRTRPGRARAPRAAPPRPSTRSGARASVMPSV